MSRRETAIGAIELATRTTASLAYRAAVAVAAFAAFLLFWINLAVGIGSEDNPANLMFGGVLAVALIGSGLARLRADRMVLALMATALAQAIAGTVAAIQALAAGLVVEPEVLGLSVFFTALWLLSAWLFRQAAPPAAS